MARLELKALQTRHLPPVTLAVDECCFTISGPSGCGKTLLLRAIADLDPHQGEVWLDGASQRGMSGPRWRRQLAYLPAEAHWWSDHVGDHFEQADTDTLARLGLSPEALDWEVARLSSGERQRLALARALALEPRALLLDEPTANLDAENRARVEQVVAEYLQRSGALAIWVSHDPEQQRRVAGLHLQWRNGRLDRHAA